MFTTSSTKDSKSAWPRVIACYFSIVIVSIAIFITWAVRQNMDLVRKDYYADEIQFQNHLDQVNRTQQLSQKPQIRYDANADAVFISLEKPSSVSGKVHFYRPSDAALDQKLKLSLNDSGSQQIDVRHFSSGLWKVRINWAAGDKEFFAEETVVIEHQRS